MQMWFIGKTVALLNTPPKHDDTSWSWVWTFDFDLRKCNPIIPAFQEHSLSPDSHHRPGNAGWTFCGCHYHMFLRCRQSDLYSPETNRSAGTRWKGRVKLDCNKTESQQPFKQMYERSVTWPSVQSFTIPPVWVIPKLVPSSWFHTVGRFFVFNKDTFNLSKPSP